MGWVYTSIKIEGAFSTWKRTAGRRKRAGQMLSATPEPPQVTAAAGQLGGSKARAVQGTWGCGESQRGRGCGPARELKVGP